MTRISKPAARVGPHQLRTLMMIGSPTMRLLTPDRSATALVRRGLCRQCESGAVCITPAGLRVLADEMEAGRVDDALAASQLSSLAQPIRSRR